jgi:hypothetical protein
MQFQVLAKFSQAPLLTIASSAADSDQPTA